MFLNVFYSFVPKQTKTLCPLLLNFQHKRQNPYVQPMTSKLRRCIHSNAISFSRAPSVAGGPSMEIDVKKYICKRLKQTRCLQSWWHYMAGRAGGPPTHVETKLISPCRVRRHPLHLLSGLWLRLERRLWPLGAEETKLAYCETRSEMCKTILRVCRRTALAAILDWTCSFLAEAFHLSEHFVLQSCSLGVLESVFFSVPRCYLLTFM